ncbi:MAG: hypothetical protein JRH20_26830, partial [Deltaproteobacteria bacterium]|nr:hypothetical protein [Deltaproteobacteria bacterium]
MKHSQKKRFRPTEDISPRYPQQEATSLTRREMLMAALSSVALFSLSACGVPDMSYPLPLDAGDIGPDSADDTDAQGESS